MADTACLTGGELNAAVTKALVTIQTSHLGRGPAKASTFHHDNVLVTLLHDVLNHAEKILGHNGQRTSVMDWRETPQTVLEPDFRAAVERLTGRTVIRLHQRQPPRPRRRRGEVHPRRAALNAPL